MTFPELHRDPVDDQHFPLPLSTLEVVTSAYDPTYGETPSTETLARCSTCAALVEVRDVHDHAAWHNAAPGPRPIPEETTP